MFNREKYGTYPKIGKVFVRSKNEADFIYREIFNTEDYTGGGIVLKEGDVIFDVGANIGFFTLFAALECGGDCFIYGFEPIPDNFELLEMNVRHHGLEKKVKLFKAGLTHSNGPGEAQFVYYPGMGGNSTMRPGEKETIYRDADPDNIIKMLKVTDPLSYWMLMALYPLRKIIVKRKMKQSLQGQEVTCPLTTLSDICVSEKITVIDLLKIDVEGAELDILHGIKKDDWPRIRQVTMEIHDIDSRIDEATSLLKENGFSYITTVKPQWSELADSETYNLYAHR